jgi:hypothetical protein
VFLVPAADQPEGAELDLTAFDTPEPEVGGSASSGSKTRMAHPGPDDSHQRDESEFPHGDAAEWSEPVSRAALRFNFPFAAEIDRFLPPLVVLGSLAWLVCETISQNDSHVTWISVVRTALLLLVFAAIVYPVTFLGTQIASRRLKYLLPHGARWRAFACYFPAFAIAAVMWQVGAGTIGSLFAGIVGGLLIALSLHVLLFRLRPDEIVESLVLAGASFVIGIFVAGLLMMAANYFTRNGVVQGHHLAQVPVSPVGVGFDWPAEEPTPLAIAPQPKALLPGDEETPSPQTTPPAAAPSAVAQPAPQAAQEPAESPSVAAPPQAPSQSTPEPPAAPPSQSPAQEVSPPVAVAPALPAAMPHEDQSSGVPGEISSVPPPVIVKPVVAKSSAVGAAPATDRLPDFVISSTTPPLPSDMDSIIYPATGSPFRAVVRGRDENGMIPVELWDSRTWNDQPPPTPQTALFAPTSGVDAGLILSPDGRLLARLANFPHTLVQVWSFPDNRIIHTLPLDQNAKLLGFIDDRRLALLTQQNGAAQLEVWNTATESRVRAVSTPPVGSEVCTGRAISPDGRYFAVATGRLEVAGRSRGDTPQPSQNIAGLAIYPLDTLTPRNTRFAGWDPKYPVTPTGMAFSPDGSRVALLFEQSGTGLISCYHTDGVYRPTVEYPFPGSPVPGRGNKPFSGTAIQWLGTADSHSGGLWLLYGQRIIDSATGTTEGDLPTSDAIEQHIDGDTVELIVAGPDNHKVLQSMKLDLKKLTAPTPSAAR